MPVNIQAILIHLYLGMECMPDYEVTARCVAMTSLVEHIYICTRGPYTVMVTYQASDYPQQSQLIHKQVSQCPKPEWQYVLPAQKTYTNTH